MNKTFHDVAIDLGNIIDRLSDANRRGDSGKVQNEVLKLAAARDDLCRMMLSQQQKKERTESKAY